MNRWAWLGAIGTGIFAFVLRLRGLANPHAFMFDETYYAKDALALLNGGHSRAFVENADTIILNGDPTNILLADPSFTVHPEFGKWLIALGIKAFGMDPFGWRIAAAVIGSLTVVVVARIVWHLTVSVWASAFAGFLLAIEGLHFVMSRMAMLDVFLAFWVTLAVLFVIKDRGKTGWLRPWQILAGISFGLAVATKWNALYVLAVFGIAVWIWDRRETFTRWFTAGLAAFVRIVVVALLVYVATWAGWLKSSDVYHDAFAVSHNWTVHESEGIIGALRDLGSYHRQMLDFHTGDYLAEQTHSYASKPSTWLVLHRPVNAFAENSMSPSLCEADEDSVCMQQVLMLGNPVIWWSGIVTLFLAAFAAGASRHWRWSVPLLGVASTWLPWFTAGTRPIFQFYAVVTIPFTIIGIALVAQRGLTFIEKRSPQNIWWARAMVMTFAIGSLAAFIYFYPILTATTIPREAWQARMWFSTWI